MFFLHFTRLEQGRVLRGPKWEFGQCLFNWPTDMRHLLRCGKSGPHNTISWGVEWNVTTSIARPQVYLSDRGRLLVEWVPFAPTLQLQDLIKQPLRNTKYINQTSLLLADLIKRPFYIGRFNQTSLLLADLIKRPFYILAGLIKRPFTLSGQLVMKQEERLPNQQNRANKRNAGITTR